jgi:hypothetical protein
MGRMKLQIIHILAIGLGMVAMAARAEQLDYIVDQRHDLMNTDITGHNIQMFGPMVQEFVPQASLLNVIELWTRDFGSPRTNGLGAALELLLRLDTTRGELLAASNPVFLDDNHDGITRFEFREPVHVTAGTRYAFEVRVLEGDLWGVVSYGGKYPQYPHGRYFRGSTTTDLTMWFRTGLKHRPIQIRFTSQNRLEWEGEAALTYRVWGSDGLTNWEVLGTVSSSDSRFVFQADPNHEHLFYRVSFP